MPMRATTVRFSEDLWTLLEAEAAHQGVSAAQLVRDGTLMRLGVLSARRGDEAAQLTLQALAAGALVGRTVPPPDSAVHDPERLAALTDTGLLDSPADPAYDRIAELAASMLDAPVALI